MGWSRGAISSVALLNWVAMGVGSFCWGAISDRVGGRGVTLAGGFLLGFGLVLSSQAQALWQFYVTFGVLVGFAAGAFYAPLTSTVTRWFSARRGLAVALVSSGIGVGILSIPPLARALTSAWDWRVAMLILGDVAWLVTIPTALLIREGPGEAGAPTGAPVTGPQHPSGQVFRAPQFWAIAVTHFACCAAHSGPIFHALAVVFGVAYGGVMPLYALVTREYFGEKVMGTAYGAVFLISALGMGLGSLAGGLIHDRLGAYAWLYIGSALIGTMALVLALTFRPPAGLGARLLEAPAAR